MRVRLREVYKSFRAVNRVNLSIRETFGRRCPSLPMISVLKNISFSVGAGECVAVLGPNGAGKSTLLRLIARISLPTLGKIEVMGRVAPLIAAGAGFHPEMTGRENIYLNGTILGERKKNLDGVFDAIVEFSGLSDKMNTPVKHYSSGQYVRLAFAIAVHTHCDIFLIDEILAVTDETFKQRCLEKIGQMRSMGKTFFVVSHDRRGLMSVCSKALVLNDGYASSLNDIGEFLFRSPEIQTSDDYRPQSP